MSVLSCFPQYLCSAYSKNEKLKSIEVFDKFDDVELILLFIRVFVHPMPISVIMKLRKRKGNSVLCLEQSQQISHDEV